MNKENEKRMYVLVPYNLSEIQKGIQAAHAIAEYSELMYGENDYRATEDLPKYIDWAENWKTIIVLNGGTTGNNSTMEKYTIDLEKLDVYFSIFREPDLNDAMTAVAFVVDMVEDRHVVGYLKQMGLA